MIETLSLNGELIDLSIDAEIITYEDRKPGFLTVSQELQKAEKTHVLITADALYLDHGQGSNVAAQLLDLMKTVSSGNYGDYKVVIPFDRQVYIADMSLRESFNLVTGEMIVDLEVALAITRAQATALIAFPGGTLTTSFETDGVDFQTVTLDFQAYLTTKRMPFQRLLISASIAGFVIFIGILLINYVVTNRQIPSLPTLAQTQGQALLPHDMRSLGDLLTTSNPLFAHGLTQIEQQATYRGVPYIFVRGAFQRNTHYARLVTLADHYGSGALRLTSDGWVVDSIRGFQNTAPLEDLKPIAEHMDELLQILYRYSERVTFEVPKSNRDSIDYPMIFTLQLPSSVLLTQLADDLAGLDIHGRVAGFYFEAEPDGTWREGTIHLYITGAL